MNIEPDQDVFSLTVPSDPRALAVVRAVVEAVCKLAGHDGQTCYEVVLAAHEACSNAMRHAHDNQRHLPVTLHLCLTSEGLEIRVEDAGEGFDLQLAMSQDPSALRKGGRGLLLIQHCMGEVSCRPRPGGGHELRLFRRASQNRR